MGAAIAVLFRSAAWLRFDDAGTFDSLQGWFDRSKVALLVVFCSLLPLILGNSGCDPG